MRATSLLILLLSSAAAIAADEPLTPTQKRETLRERIAIANEDITAINAILDVIKLKVAAALLGKEYEAYK